VILTIRLAMAATILPSANARIGALVPPLPTIADLHYEGGADWFEIPGSPSNLLTAIRGETGPRVAGRPAEARPIDPGLCNRLVPHVTSQGDLRPTEADLDGESGTEAVR
jgi:hypothetical protein